jgi:ATP-dependent Lon protease
MPDEARKAADNELERLRIIPPESAEHTVVRTYLEWLVNLPWATSTEDNLDIPHARSVLDEDHFDLEKVKDRILEYLAVRKLRKDPKGPILCFVGPPGIGKTSLGRSIAKAMERKFVRSLGGVRDERDPRPSPHLHRVARPHHQSLRTAGSNNPMFMLDEVDKLGGGFRGDPPRRSSKCRSRAEPRLRRPLPRRARRSLEGRRATTATTSTRFRPPSSTAWRCSSSPGTSRKKIQISGAPHPKQIRENGLTDANIAFTEGAC